MKLRDFKIGLCVLFMSIFMTKMLISIAPVILNLDNKTVSAAITQLEQETKGEKDSPEKEQAKGKKFIDEAVSYYTAPNFITTAITTLHNRENSLVVQLYHPVVPTPPPNA